MGRGGARGVALQAMLCIGIASHALYWHCRTLMRRSFSIASDSRSAAASTARVHGGRGEGVVINSGEGYVQRLPLTLTYAA